jgi:hypothetical protein
MMSSAAALNGLVGQGQQQGNGTHLEDDTEGSSDEQPPTVRYLFVVFLPTADHPYSPKNVPSALSARASQTLTSTTAPKTVPPPPRTPHNLALVEANCHALPRPRHRKNSPPRSASRQTATALPLKEETGRPPQRVHTAMISAKVSRRSPALQRRLLSLGRYRWTWIPRSRRWSRPDFSFF